MYLVGMALLAQTRFRRVRTHVPASLRVRKSALGKILSLWREGRHEPYGRLEGYAGTRSSRYTWGAGGKEWVEEIGGYNFGSRILRDGIWMSQDPKGQFASPYVTGANPINSLDPDGNEVVEDNMRGKIDLGSNDWFRSDGPSSVQIEQLKLFKIGETWASMQDIKADIPSQLFSNEPKQSSNVNLQIKLMDDLTVQGVASLAIGKIERGTVLRGSVQPDFGRGSLDVIPAKLFGLISNIGISFTPISTSFFLQGGMSRLYSNFVPRPIWVLNAKASWGLFTPYAIGEVMLPPQTLPYMIGGNGHAK